MYHTHTFKKFLANKFKFKFSVYYWRTRPQFSKLKENERIKEQIDPDWGLCSKFQQTNTNVWFTILPKAISIEI